MKKQLLLPKFKDEDEERDFWDKIDITEYFEPSDLKPFVLADLIKKAKKKTRKVTMRLPEQWIEDAKEKANKQDLPYQRLLKQFIRQGLYSKTNPV